MKEKDLEKKLDEVLGKLAEVLGGTMKPKFKIVMETQENREGYHVQVEGTRPSIMLALSELAGHLVEETNLTKEDILEAVNDGLEEVEEE